MNRYNTALFVLSLVVAPAFALAADQAPNISPKEVSVLQAKADAPTLLDVRTPGEFENGHVPGAVNIPHTELANRVAEVPSENGVIVYCMKGPRARLGEQTLRDAGIPLEKIRHLDGGFSAWSAAGLPVKKGPE